MEQSFASEWRKRDPGVSVFNYRFAAFSFPATPRSYELAGEELGERLKGRPLKLIVAQGNPSINLAVPFRASFFPDVPIIAYEATDEMKAKYENESDLYQFNSQN